MAKRKKKKSALRKRKKKGVTRKRLTSKARYRKAAYLARFHPRTCVCAHCS